MARGGAPKPRTAAKKKAPAKKPAPSRRARAVAGDLVNPERAIAEELNLPTGRDGQLVPISEMLKYQLFVSSYLTDGNATKAARDAGYVASNDAALRKVAQRLLENDLVKEMITLQYQALKVKYMATPERIWQEVAQIAFCDPLNAYDETGELLPMNRIDEATRRAMNGYEIEERTFGEATVVTRKAKFGDKLAALNTLMKLNGMLKDDRLVVLGGEEFMQAMAEGRARAEAAAKGRADARRLGRE